jgi:hypothetical protein
MKRGANDYLDSAEELLAYCKAKNWAGYDPFDGLNSRIFPSAISIRILRLAWIQFFKRCPLNLRKLVFVPPMQNPKGLALFASAMVALNRRVEAENILNQLINLRSKGWSTACWGYHFDWQTRGYLIPLYTPNVICTSFASTALLDAYEMYGDPQFLELAASAGKFVLRELKRTGNADEFCFSYTPLRPSLVHNASLLGAALLARLYSFTGEKEMHDAAMGAAWYSIKRQKEDGSWPYGEEDHQEWVDSFHTGYNLLALRDIANNIHWEPADAAFNKGFRYYRTNFFPGNGIVKYYHNRVHPIDIHAVAHSIITLVQLRNLDEGNIDLAESVLNWALKEMRSSSGCFYYQKWPWMTNRIPYMRWSQAWMLYAMACMAKAKKNL